MTSGFYPVGALADSNEFSFKTTYDLMMNAPIQYGRSEFPPGYQGHLQGTKYIIGQGSPAGNRISRPDSRGSTSGHHIHRHPRDGHRTHHNVNDNVVSPGGHDGSAILNVPDSSMGRSGYFIPAIIHDSASCYCPPAYATSKRQESLPESFSHDKRKPGILKSYLSDDSITKANGRGTGYDSGRKASVEWWPKAH